MDSVKKRRQIKILLFLAVSLSLILIPTYLIFSFYSDVNIHESQDQWEQCDQDVSSEGIKAQSKNPFSQDYPATPNRNDIFAFQQLTSFPFQPSWPNEKTSRTLRC
jgi:hypothetical protein